MQESRQKIKLLYIMGCLALTITDCKISRQFNCGAVRFAGWRGIAESYEKLDGADRAVDFSGACEQAHEAEIHVLLHMTMKQAEARLVGCEVGLDLAVLSDHDNVFHDAGGG
jgi:hypothetical protein